MKYAVSSSCKTVQPNKMSPASDIVGREPQQVLVCLIIINITASSVPGNLTHYNYHSQRDHQLLSALQHHHHHQHLIPCPPEYVIVRIRLIGMIYYTRLWFDGCGVSVVWSGLRQKLKLLLFSYLLGIRVYSFIHWFNRWCPVPRPVNHQYLRTTCPPIYGYLNQCKLLTPCTPLDDDATTQDQTSDQSS